MHIPDGFLNNTTASSLIVAASGAIIWAINKVRQKFFIKEKIAVLKTPEGVEFGGGVVTKLTRYGQSKIFKMASLGAFIFAAQMINFPVVHGTSGHFLGGILAAVLLGPAEGLLVLSLVLVIQSLFFADGGLIALGANIFNMAIVGTLGAYWFYSFLIKKINKWLVIFIASWISIILASIACSFEIAISGTESLSNVFYAMTSVHALIGIGEAIITIFILQLMKDDE